MARAAGPNKNEQEIEEGKAKGKAGKTIGNTCPASGQGQEPPTSIHGPRSCVNVCELGFLFGHYIKLAICGDS